MGVPAVSISDELREYLASKNADSIAVDIIDCVSCSRHLSEVFAFAAKGLMLKEAEGKAEAVFECGGIKVLIANPAITWDDEIVLTYNGNRHLGSIDAEGLHA